MKVRRTNRSSGREGGREGVRRWFPGYIVDETLKLGYKLLRRSFFDLFPPPPDTRMQSWKVCILGGIIDYTALIGGTIKGKENNYYEAYHD